MTKNTPPFFDDPAVHAFAIGLLRGGTRQTEHIRIAGVIVRATSFLLGVALAIAAIISWAGDARILSFVFVGALSVTAGVGLWASRITDALLHMMVVDHAILELVMVQAGLREMPDLGKVRS